MPGTALLNIAKRTRSASPHKALALPSPLRVMAPTHLFACATTLFLATAAVASPTIFPLSKRGSIPSDLRAQWVQHQGAIVQNKIQSSLVNYEKNKNKSGKRSAFGDQLQARRPPDWQPAKRAGNTGSANLTECEFSSSWNERRRLTIVSSLGNYARRVLLCHRKDHPIIRFRFVSHTPRSLLARLRNNFTLSRIRVSMPAESLA